MALFINLITCSRKLLQTVILFTTIINVACNQNQASKKLKSSNVSPNSSLLFVIQKQAALNLCWAAVASSVSKFYDKNSSYTQCKLANYAFNTTDCCNNLNSCDRPWFLDKALSYTGNLKEMKSGTPSFDLIKNEITNGRLICVRIEWRSRAGHFAVIHGYHDNGDIDVQDPWPDKNPGTIPLVELEMFYKDLGAITHYYLTKPIYE